MFKSLRCRIDGERVASNTVAPLWTRDGPSHGGEIGTSVVTDPRPSLLRTVWRVGATKTHRPRAEALRRKGQSMRGGRRGVLNRPFQDDRRLGGVGDYPGFVSERHLEPILARFP